MLQSRQLGEEPCQLAEACSPARDRGSERHLCPPCAMLAFPDQSLRVFGKSVSARGPDVSVTLVSHPPAGEGSHPPHRVTEEPGETDTMQSRVTSQPGLALRSVRARRAPHAVPVQEAWAGHGRGPAWGAEASHSVLKAALAKGGRPGEHCAV